MGKRDGTYPPGCHIRRPGHFPAGVEGPLSLGDFHVGDNASQQGDGGDYALFPSEVPVEEWTVQYQGLDYGRMLSAFEIRCDESAGGVPHQNHFLYPGLLHGYEGGVYVGEIMGEVAHVEWLLPGQERTSVTA